MIFRETLPDDCPPGAAEEIAEQCDVYRLVASDPPTEADFRSQRALRPAAVFGVSECQAHGFQCTRNGRTRSGHQSFQD